MADITPSQEDLVRMFSPRQWEAVVGHQYNKNSEGNQMRQQADLTSQGHTQVGMGSGGRKK